MYRPVWSSAILAELAYHEAKKLAERYGLDSAQAEERAERLISTMRSAFDDAEVTGWEPLEGTYGLPDEDDEHVVAAALVGGAGAIVTSNLRDFPSNKVPTTIDVLAPSTFALNTVALSPQTARRAVTEIAVRSGRSGLRLNVEEMLDLLSERYGMTEAVKYLR